MHEEKCKGANEEGRNKLETNSDQRVTGVLTGGKHFSRLCWSSGESTERGLEMEI